MSRNLAIDLRRRTEAGERAFLKRPFDPVSHTDVSGLMQKLHALVLIPEADRQVL